MNHIFKNWEDLVHPDCPEQFSGAQVKAIRTMQGWTIPQMASLLGVTRQTVHNWEHDGMDVLRSCALKFAVVYVDLLEKPKENAHEEQTH